MFSFWFDCLQEREGLVAFIGGIIFMIGILAIIAL